MWCHGSEWDVLGLCFMLASVTLVMTVMASFSLTVSQLLLLVATRRVVQDQMHQGKQSKHCVHHAEGTVDSPCKGVNAPVV